MFPCNKSKTLHLLTHTITSHPLISLFLLTLFLIKTLLILSASPPLPPPSDTACHHGTVYVYHLPTFFNSDLLPTCPDLHPYQWQCGVATNSGYGSTATDLAGLIPDTLSHSWHRTNQFSSEIIFHNRILNHRCRTLEPESATAFYIPFYAGLAVGNYLFSNSSTNQRDFHAQKLIQWVQSQPYWQRSNGSDHFLTLGRITWDFRRLTDPDKRWGSKFLNMPEMETVTRLTIERAPSDPHDIGVPYPTGFHPKTLTEVKTWQDFVRSYNRTSLFSFVGAARDDVGDDIRGLLLQTCRNESACRSVDCGVVHCANGSRVIMEALLTSDFCLQPRGDSFTRRSVFDCMVAGSVPVLFWNRTVYDQYELYLPEEGESYSVFIDHGDVSEGRRSVREVLEGYSREEVRKMREKVIEIIPKIVYSDGGGEGMMEDAFEIAVDGVLKRFRMEREERRRREAAGEGSSGRT